MNSHFKLNLPIVGEITGQVEEHIWERKKVIRV